VDTAERHQFQSPLCARLRRQRYARITNAVGLAFAPDGTLFVGNDNGELPFADPASRIRRIGIGGAPVEDYSLDILPDPDALAFDVSGGISGTPGSVLVGGFYVNTASAITAILPNHQLRIVFWYYSCLLQPKQTSRGSRWPPLVR